QYATPAILPIKPLQKLNCFDSSGKTAFMTSSLVLVNDVFVGNAVDDAGCFAQHFGGGSFVAGFDSLTNALDGRAQHRAQAGIVFIERNRLAGAFASLCGVSHSDIYFTV